METTPVNIRVSTDESKDTDKTMKPPGHLSSGLYEDFLVCTNKEYRTQIIRLQEEMAEVKREKDDFEADNEKIETSQRYMRGILKNYYEIDQHNTKINGRIKDLLLQANVWSFLYKLVPVIIVIGATLFAYADNWYTSITSLILVAIACVKLYDATVAVPAKKLELFISDSNKEIEIIKKTNELLPDLFDHL